MPKTYAEWLHQEKIEILTKILGDYEDHLLAKLKQSIQKGPNINFTDEEVQNIRNQFMNDPQRNKLVRAITCYRRTSINPIHHGIKKMATGREGITKK